MIMEFLLYMFDWMVKLCSFGCMRKY